MSLHTVNQYISGGRGGAGGGGGQQGGGGGPGEGPKMHYDVETQQFNRWNMFFPELPSDEKRTKIIDWLSPINFFLRHEDISQARQHGTGEWLLANPHFEDWETGSRKTLWCHGIRAGKTVLASLVVNYLSTKSKNKNMGVACIYLNHKEAADQTPTKMLAGLWRQLVLGKDVSPFAKELYEQHKEKHTSPGLEEVFEVLCSAITEFAKVYMVIDAVDEYLETERQILFDYLVKMGPTVNVLITSRPHIILDSSLPNANTLEIRATEVDIRKFLDAQIQMSPRLKRHVQSGDNLREEIHSKITSSVDGMFLLAKLHIESLSTKSNVKRVREALKSLPKTLNDSYDGVMKRIDEQNEEDRQLAHSILTWVVNAKRPLKSREFQTALAIEPGTNSLDEDNIFEIEIILSVCAGLVIVDEQLSLVRLVHYTTQEYLDGIQSQRFPNAQTEITCSLLTFLAFSNTPDLQNYPDYGLSSLLDYSQYCLAHAVGPPENALKDMILEFLARAAKESTKSNSPQYHVEFRSIWHLQPWDYEDWPVTPSALWIASAANLLEITKFLLTREASSYYGHLQMVQLLVEHGANVNAQGGTYHTAMQAASHSGHKNIVQLLIEHGANVNAQGGRYHTAMQAASHSGHKNIVQLLIEHDGNINAQGGRWHTALQAASHSGHETIVQQLIDHGANANAQGGTYDTALQAASYKGHETIVQLLIECGGNVNGQGGRWHTALQAASDRGHRAIIQLLIEHGANVNSQGGTYDTALQAASYSGHRNIVQLLIERGADINAQGGRYSTALQAACHSGHETIVQLLIEHGANVNLEGGRYHTALQAASYSGHETIVQLLIEHHGNIDAQGGPYDTALQAASTRGHESIVQLLIECDANVNAQGGRYHTALHAASSAGHESIVQVLIENGART
ncbi:ankyrin repeat-containing domain protein [Mycena capillaripes]|nr:ankyrin repeat-containing domain protein [Mycena capillaripes]